MDESEKNFEFDSSIIFYVPLTSLSIFLESCGYWLLLVSYIRRKANCEKVGRAFLTDIEFPSP